MFPFIGTGYSSSKALKESGIDSPSDSMSSSTEETMEKPGSSVEILAAGRKKRQHSGRTI